MLNEWSDRVPARRPSRMDRARQGLGFMLLFVVTLAIGGGLMWQLLGWLLRFARTLFG